MLEKAAEQEHLLEQSAQELEKRVHAEEQLRKKLAEKELDMADLDKKYSSLQEEAQGFAQLSS